MSIVLALALFLQIAAGQRAYTLEDQSEPDHLALRTTGGTLRIVPGRGCETLQANQNVTLYLNTEGALFLATDTAGVWPVCSVSIDGQVDAAPCFTDADGYCDVAAEND